MRFALKNRGAGYTPAEAQYDESLREYVIEMHTIAALMDIFERNGRGCMLEIVKDHKKNIIILRVYGGSAPIVMSPSVPEEGSEPDPFNDDDTATTLAGQDPAEDEEDV